MSIITTQQIRVANGNFNFPSISTPLGVSNKIQTQAGLGGGAPGEIIAVSTGQGTLVDLTALSIAAGGGWCFFVNEDPTITVTWGGDNGAGTLVACGDMLAGESAGPFRCSAAQNKYRFKAASGAGSKVQAYFFPA